jgi:hypothetical protein
MRKIENSWKITSRHSFFRLNNFEEPFALDLPPTFGHILNMRIVLLIIRLQDLKQILLIPHTIVHDILQSFLLDSFNDSQ